MAFLLGGLFGGNNEQNISQYFNLSAINQSIYEQYTKNQTTSLASQANIQSMDVVMKNVVGCTSTFRQDIDASASSSSTLTNEQATAIKNAITTEMIAGVKAQIDKVTEFGNFQYGDEANISSDLNLEIQNIISNSVNVENINSAIAEQVSIQDKKITIDGYNCLEAGEINFTQDISAQLVATLITNNLTNSIASSELLNKLKADVDAASKVENKGFADLVTSFFDGLTGPMKYALLASVIGCCLLVVMVVVMGLSPAGQNATRNLSKAGAARIGRRF